MTDRERMAAKEKCPTCKCVSGPPKYVWIQFGDKLRTRWNKTTAPHFLIWKGQPFKKRSPTRTYDKVYCTHGAWYGDLVYDPEGNAVVLRHQHGTFRVAGIKPVA